jgi:hypothetical protein
MKLIILIIIFFIILILISFALSKTLTLIFRKLFKILPKKLKIINVILTITIFSSFLFYFIFYNPAKNFKTAYIEKHNDKFIITTIGKRNLMVHDPISALKKGTYIDSAKYVISKPYGIIKGKALPNEPGSYPTINNNAITIEGNSLKIDLIYYNFDDKVNKPNVWNGNYKLVKRNF